jgi:hypothetical protein
MASLVEHSTVTSSTSNYRADHMSQDFQQEFSYRPVPLMVPISIFLALASGMAFLGIFGIVISVIAIGMSLLSIRVIRNSDGAYTGIKSACVAMVLASVLGISGGCFLYYQYSTEVPGGYHRVSFAQDISRPGIGVVRGQYAIPDEVVSLKDQKVFLKGYMYPQRQTTGIKQFLLLKDTGECCFGGKPKASDMILVKVNNDSGVNHYELRRVSVGGKFNIEPEVVDDGLEPVYQMDADYFTLSKSQF